MGISEYRMKNLWDEISRLPRHHRVAIAAWIIRQDRPDMQALSRSAGLSHDTLGKRLRSHNKQSKAAPHNHSTKE